MLYYHETTEFEPDGKGGHWREDYWKEFIGRLSPNIAKRGMPVVGVWETALGAGNTNEIIFLYRTKDYTTCGEWLKAAKTDPVVINRRGEMWVYREHWYTKLMQTSPGHDLSILKATENDERWAHATDQSWLYYQETVQFEHDGKNGHWFRDYWPQFNGKLVPHLKTLKIDLVGAWETPVGSGVGSEFTFLWRTKDFGTWAEFVTSRKTDSFVKRWKAETADYLYRWDSRLLIPAPGHEVSILRKLGE